MSCEKAQGIGDVGIIDFPRLVKEECQVEVLSWKGSSELAPRSFFRFVFFVLQKGNREDTTHHRRSSGPRSTAKLAKSEMCRLSTPEGERKTIDHRQLLSSIQSVPDGEKRTYRIEPPVAHGVLSCTGLPPHRHVSYGEKKGQ